MIKYKSIKYEIFDEENYIEPKIFSKIGSRMFSVFGILELFIGLIFPSWNVAGIEEKYLLILCAPIITLYDYKKNMRCIYLVVKKRLFYLHQNNNLCIWIWHNSHLWAINTNNDEQYIIQND